VSQRVSGIGQRGPDICLGQARICIQQIGLRSTFAKFADEEFHWNVRPSNHWFAQHDGRVHFNTIC